MPDTWPRNVVAEAVGTFALVFIGVLASTVGGSLTAAALAHGVTIMAFVAALGHVSGGHFNPAITLAMFLSKKIDIVSAVRYWAAQLIGGLVAALIVLLATDQDIVAAGAPVITEGVNVFAAILVEAIATFFLVLVVYGTVVDQRAPLSIYPVAIGLTISAGIFAIGPITGGALNPARGFGPALVGGEWGGIAAWLVGPLLGGVLAWALYEYVIAPREAVAAVPDVAPDVSAPGFVAAEVESTTTTKSVAAPTAPADITPTADAAKADPPKADAPKADAPKADAPAADTSAPPSPAESTPDGEPSTPSAKKATPKKSNSRDASTAANPKP